MNDQMAKMAVLQKIMDLFTDHQMNGLKKKGQPDLLAVSVKKDDDAPQPDAPDAGKGEDGEEDPELLKMLLDHSEDDDKKSDPSC